MSFDLILPFEKKGNLKYKTESLEDEIPIEYILKKIDEIKKDEKLPNLILVQAQTGTGKSTVQPLYVWKKSQGTVYLTQPTIANTQM